MSALIRGIIGSVIGGAIGAAVWAAIAYFAHLEIGWIAVGVGFVCGLGMAVGSQGGAGMAGGVTASVIALVSIAAGKYAAVHIAVENDLQEIAGQHFQLDMDRARAVMCDQLCDEATAAGKQLKWPDGYDYKSAQEVSHYPAEICKDMESRWKRMNEDEREAYRAAQEASINATMQASLSSISSAVKEEGFISSFSAFDALWAIFAVGAAFKLGASDGTPEAD